MKRFAGVALAVVVSCIPVNVSAFDITGGIATSAVYQGIMSELNASINQAFSNGNFLVWHAGVEARLTLDRWGQVNKDLLDKAFDGLDAEQRKFFRNTNDLVSELNASADAITDKAQTLIDQTQQVVADVKFWDGEPTILRYAPSILNAERKTTKVLTLTGINLSKADPKVALNIDGQKIKLERTSLTLQEARFEIPENLVTASDFATKDIAGEVTLSYKKKKFLGLFGSEQIDITTNLSILSLPKYVGEIISLETFKTVEGRDYTDWKSREFHFSSGSLDTKCDVQTQNPALDFRIDPDTIGVWNNRPNPNAGKPWVFGLKHPATLPGEWGKAGSHRVEHKSTEGFAVRVCAKRWTCCFPPDTGPGYQHVVYRWKEFKQNETTEKKQFPGGNLSWEKDFLTQVEPGSQGLIAHVRLFTGEQRIEIRERLSGRYYSIEFEPLTGAVLFKPQMPADVAALVN